LDGQGRSSPKRVVSSDVDFKSVDPSDAPMAGVGQMAMGGQEGGDGVLAWLAYAWRGEERSVELGRLLVIMAVREWIWARIGRSWRGLAQRDAGYRWHHGRRDGAGRRKWPGRPAPLAPSTWEREREGSEVVEVRG
jgi:hypothetical protein